MLKVGFLGAGRMASAMVEGILRDRSFASSEIICYSAPDGTGEALAKRTRIAFTEELHLYILTLIPVQRLGSTSILFDTPAAMYIS